MAYALQSVSLNSVLTAVNTVLTNGVGDPVTGAIIPSTGIDSTYIQQNYSSFVPRSGEPYQLTFGLMEEQPYPYPGGGRWAANTFFTLEICLYTRQELDFSGADTDWASDPTYGAMVKRMAINDILDQLFLWSSYDVNTLLPNGTPLTIEGLQLTDNPRPGKPDRTTTADGEDSTYGITRLYYSMKLVAPLSIS